MLFGLTVPLIDFEIPLDVIVLGALAGVAYALFGMGLTLTYQSSRVINFAQGAMGAVPHLLVASLVIDHAWSYWAALPLALATGVAFGAILELCVVRRLHDAPRLVVLVATLGAAQLFTIPITFMVNLSDTQMGRAPYPTPFDASLTVGNLKLASGQLLILVVGPVIVLGLTAFLRLTTVGTASRASAENLEAAQLSGIPVRRISLIVWSLGGLLAASSAILIGPTQPILSTALGSGATFSGNGDLLLSGLGAAMIGGLLSLPQVFAAGVVLGVVENLVRWNYPSSRGLIQLVTMGIILGCLLLRKDLRQAARGGEETTWSLAGGVRALPERVRRHPRVKQARTAGIGVVLLFGVLLPLTSGPAQRILFSAILIYLIVGLSLVILTGWAGQVTLGHFTFVALGAVIGGRMHQLGYPVYGAVAVTLTAGAVLAVFVGLPALRTKGLFLAVTTLAFAVVADSWLVNQSWLVNRAGGTSLRIGRPTAFGIDFQQELNFYYLTLAVTVLVAVAVHLLGKSGFARILIAVRDNEPMAAALSVSPASVKVLGFVVAGCLASGAGYLYGMLLVNFSNVALTATGFSLSMVTMVIVGGPTSVTGAVLGAMYVRGLPYFFQSDWAVLLTSGAGLLVVILFIPGGLAALVFRVRDRVVRTLTGIDVNTAYDEADDLRVHALELTPKEQTVDVPPDAAPPLAAEHIVVRFGGLFALNDVSLHVERGEILGLLGPNGAGKTTLFDVLSGLVQPRSGRVLLHGEDITSLPPEERARLRLSRSFQQCRLFGDLTVREAFKIALERESPTELIPSLFSLPPARAAERRKDLRADELIDLLGLGPFSRRKASELSTGTRRIAELGCTIAIGAEVVLLDEPTGGVAQREVEAFVPVLRQIRDHLDASMVIVAHDIPFVMSLCDRVYVLASGEVIAEGPPSVLQENPAVIAAYLGVDDADAVTGGLHRPDERDEELV